MKKKKSIALVIIIILLVSIITLTISYSNKNQDSIKVEKSLDGLILIHGGNYIMGSPDTENWRNEDETTHEVTISDFYISETEVTQNDFADIMGYNPSYFKGSKLPIENISWYEAIEYCNLLSIKNGLTPVYIIEDNQITWDLGANGYRLPTEAEWEYASRAGTNNPFNTENSIKALEANYNGKYPYEIENYYFEQDKLETTPGEYRKKTIEVGSLSHNKWGLYDMHGNVSEWVYDYYDEYDIDNAVNPYGPEEGTYKIARGGSWSDSAKHLRNAYRSVASPATKSSNIGFRIVRNVKNNTGTAITKKVSNIVLPPENILILYFDDSIETIAQEIKNNLIQKVDIIKLETTKPYSNDPSELLKESILDLKNNNLPALKQINNIEKYDTIFIGYSNWWTTLPLPIISFFEEYNLAGKTIIPFCVHTDEFSSQSYSDIAKLSPYSNIGQILNINIQDKNSQAIIKNWLIEIGLS